MPCGDNMPPLVGEFGSSPANTELLEREPFLRMLVGGGRSTPMPARESDSGLLPKSDEDWSLLLPAMYPAPAPRAAAPRAAPWPLDPLEWSSKADMRAMRPPGK